MTRLTTCLGNFSFNLHERMRVASLSNGDESERDDGGGRSKHVESSEENKLSSSIAQNVSLSSEINGSASDVQERDWTGRRG